VSSRAIFKLQDNGAARLSLALPVGEQGSVGTARRGGDVVMGAGGGGGGAQSGAGGAGTSRAAQEEDDELL
jgi:hypothetical protein